MSKFEIDCDDGPEGIEEEEEEVQEEEDPGFVEDDNGDDNGDDDGDDDFQESVKDQYPNDDDDDEEEEEEEDEAPLDGSFDILLDRVRQRQLKSITKLENFDFVGSPLEKE
jgi:hypothetical protein